MIIIAVATLLLLRIQRSRFELWSIEEDDSQAHIKGRGQTCYRFDYPFMRYSTCRDLETFLTAHSRLGLCDDAVLPCSCRSNGVITHMQKLQAERERYCEVKGVLTSIGGIPLTKPSKLSMPS